MARKRFFALVVAVVLATTSASTGRSDGPILLDGGAEIASAYLCSPARNGDLRHTLNGVGIKNEGSRPVTITDVSLIDAKSMSMIESILVPIPEPDPKTGIVYYVPANGPGYPALLSERDPDGQEKEYNEAERRLWAARRLAIGEQLEPGEEWNMIVGLVARALPATMKSVRIDYQDGPGQQYAGSSGTSVTIKRRCF